ncbi:biotin/lipoyl-containing protein [Peptoniphilus stercorisuis]|uniref:Glutaconyl-CoA decarboxylase n=1 Tax=Peptoniphilus stercorisuis TaxID=1436965 RepID=A0ABS4KC86_9FIRM|nr:biotin/lipoyl-containing protein [Peptoniphilus stercorisuis]MBP2025367.1 glutaconyl-CoA decarboxylase [Peptoniphilus stercorisuis]
MKYQVTVDGKVYEVEVEKVGAAHKSLSMSDFGMAPAQPVQPVQQAPVQQAAPAASTGGEQVMSPMPGNILKVNVSEGQQVNAGDVILILEAMKMENEIVASCAGTVSVKVKAGDTVDTDQLLAEIK